jgi:hypothetical protein
MREIRAESVRPLENCFGALGVDRKVPRPDLLTTTKYNIAIRPRLRSDVRWMCRATT